MSRETLKTTGRDARINELRELLSAGADAFRRAGEIVVELMEDGETLPTLQEMTRIPLDVLAQLERIGRKQLNPELLLADYPAAVAMSRMPMSEQDRLMREPVEVFVFNGGKADARLVMAHNMSSAQARQVFARGYVRPLSEQRAWLEARQVQEPPVKSAMPYEITRRHTVIFRQAVEMSSKELLRIAAQLQD